MRLSFLFPLCCAFGLSACGMPAFTDKFNDPSRFSAAKLECRRDASAYADHGEVEPRAGSTTAEEVGTELGAAMAESIRFRKGYKACMKAKGYMAK